MQPLPGKRNSFCNRLRKYGCAVGYLNLSPEIS